MNTHDSWMEIIHPITGKVTIYPVVKTVWDSPLNEVQQQYRNQK